MDEPITGINVTPLIDIVLVLLIVMLVAFGYLASRAIPVSTAGAGETSGLALTLEVDARGRLALDGAPTTREALKQRLQALADPGATRAVVVGERDTSHGAIVRLLDLLRIEGVTQISFARPR